MKKIVLSFLFIITAVHTFSQFLQPNFKTIKKNIANKESSFYYPSLMERYLKGDSTLTDEECHHLYYGFTFQKNYHPYESEDEALMKYLREKPGLNDKECEKSIEYAQEALAKNPFNVTALNTLSYCYDQLDNIADMEKCSQQIRTIAVAIIRSGNGKSEQTAFYVNEISHEYFLLALFGLSHKKQSFSKIKKSYYDILEISDNDYGLTKLYFNTDTFFK